jgi:hypothetical protein
VAKTTQLTNLNVTSSLTVAGVIISNIVPVQIVATAGSGLGYPFFIAKGAWEVVAVTERHATAESTAGTLTAMLKKVASGTALVSGTDCLAAGINMKATANTNQSGTLHGTQANYQLADGNALGIILSASPTELANITFTVWLKRI